MKYKSHKALAADLAAMALLDVLLLTNMDTFTLRNIMRNSALAKKRFRSFADVWGERKVQTVFVVRIK